MFMKVVRKGGDERRKGRRGRESTVRGYSICETGEGEVLSMEGGGDRRTNPHHHRDLLMGSARRGERLPPPKGDGRNPAGPAAKVGRRGGCTGLT